MTNRIKLFFASLTFFAAMSLAYALSVSPAFSQHAFFPLPLNLSSFQAVFIALATSGFVAFLDLRKKNLADIFSLIAILFFLMPVAVVAAMDYERSIIWVLICFAALMPAHFIPKLIFVKKISAQRVHANSARRAVNVLLVSCLLIFLVITLSSGALGRINFNLLDIYQYREMQQRELGGGVIAYLSIWVPRIILPYLLIVAIFSKNHTAMIALMLLVPYFFGIMNDRQILFIPALSACFYFFLKSKLEIYSFLLIFSSFLLAITLVAAMELVPDEVASILLRRAFFVPAAASFSWYDFFSANDFVVWSDRFGFLFGSTQYSNESLPRLMGFAIREDREWNANAGLVSTGFANLGVAGVLVYSGLLGFLLKFYVFAGRGGVPHWLIGALVANPLKTAWSDTDFMTALTSHGLLLILIIFLFASDSIRETSQ